MLKALTSQVGGQKIIFINETGAVCKLASGNELQWYNRCKNETNLNPFLEVMPDVIDQF